MTEPSMIRPIIHHLSPLILSFTVRWDHEMQVLEDGGSGHRQGAARQVVDDRAEHDQADHPPPESPDFELHRAMVSWGFRQCSRGPFYETSTRTIMLVDRCPGGLRPGGGASEDHRHRQHRREGGQRSTSMIVRVEVS